MRTKRMWLSVLSVTALLAGVAFAAGADRLLLAHAASATDPANLFDPDAATFATIEGWAATDGAMLHHSTVTGYEDDTSLQVTVIDGDLATVLVEGPPAAVTAGHGYRASLRIRAATSPATVSCALAFLDADGEQVASGEGEAVEQVAGEWTEAACEGTAPDGAASAAVGIVVAGPSAGDVQHVDDVRLAEVAPAPPGDPDDEEPPAGGGDAPRGQNLLSDDQHSFESSTRGWAPQGNTTLARKVGTAAVGESSLMIMVDESGPWPDSSRTARAGTHYLRQYGVAVDAGTAYEASWRIKAHRTEAPARCELRWYAADDTELELVSGETVTATGDGWTTARCDGVAPAGASHVSLRVLVTEVDYGSVFYVDDAWLTAAGGTPDPPPSPAPKPSPTADPDPTPDPDPTEEPTGDPTEEPTGDPTEEPTGDPTEEPTGDPTEEPTRDPDPVPPPGGTPSHGRHMDSSNTGPSANGLSYGDLQRSESVRTSRNGQVIEGLDVTGSIIIDHDNVVVRNSRVRQSSHYAIHGRGRNARIEFVEVDGRNNPDRIGILYGPNWTVRFTEVRGHNTGVRLRPGGTLEYSYVHSQALKPGSHNAAASFHGGSGIRISDNHLIGSTSSSLSLYPESPVIDALVERNLFNGGSYCVYAGYGPKPGSSQSRDIRYIDNLFAQSPYPLCGHYGPYVNWDGSKPGNVWRGNTYVDGSPL